MNRALVALTAGLCLVGGLAVLGLAWPLAYRLMAPGGVEVVAPGEAKVERSALVEDLGAAGFELGDKAHLRLFKRERMLELWLRAEGERFGLFRSYPICSFSGELGPKLAEGDRQAPEGFYRVALRQLNPHSRHHLAFNLGFPNAYDRALGRTGSALMVHGGCSSAGCFAMGDAQVDEIYAVVEAALRGGQGAVDVAIFPFRLGGPALVAEAGNPWAPFWNNLKEGFDLFERNGVPPEVGVRDGAYCFGEAAREPGCVPIAGWV